MSKSFDFVLNVINDPSRGSAFRNRNFENAQELSSEDFFDANFTSKKLRSWRTECVNIEIVFDSNAEFDYCASNSMLSDGTLLNTYCAISEIFKRIICGETCFKLKADEVSIGDTVRYTIGNIILSVEHGNFGTKEKPWLSERISVMIPIKYDVICKEIRA